MRSPLRLHRSIDEDRLGSPALMLSEPRVAPRQICSAALRPTWPSHNLTNIRFGVWGKIPIQIRGESGKVRNRRYFAIPSCIAKRPLATPIADLHRRYLALDLIRWRRSKPAPFVPRSPSTIAINAEVSTAITGAARSRRRFRRA